MPLTFRHSNPPLDQAMQLYNSVGWSNYTDEPNLLEAGLNNSLRVMCAYKGKKLIGLARIVGDGATICYLQDILVHPDFHRQGLGSALITKVFEGFNVRQKVLITDDDPAVLAFYESLGFIDSRNLQFPLTTFVQFSKV